ncbi:MAG: acetylornithine/succinylornithine family transaminase ['Candidatus Kapabacteria' thiocyanatum]|nr:acetylornithine/succinylornithine family transaminase ['Candidatus Kapabacteria' thiocyanatum]
MMNDQGGMLIEREHAVVFQTYKRLPVAIAHAEGCRVTDVDGTSYLDMLGGIAVNALGHSHPKVVEAVVDQARRYMHVSNFFYQEPQIRLAEALVEVSGYPRIFFSNSGAEATDGAIKMARRFGSRQGRYDVIGFTGGFHGRTYGALSVMDKPLYKDGMGPFLPNTMVLPYNDVDALESRVDEHTAAVILEFVQGEGGVTEATSEFVEAIWRLKERYGFMVIADEVQAGIGRTGTFFSFERYGVRPDIVTVAKAMGGGLPLGGILATEEAAALFERGMHGTTYGGNALACAAGAVVVEEVVDGLMAHVVEIGDYLRARLLDLQARMPDRIRELRGRGCMQGVVLTSDAAPVVTALLERRIIANATSGNVVRLVPPYVISRAEVDEFVATFGDALRATTAPAA